MTSETPTNDDFTFSLGDDQKTLTVTLPANTQNQLTLDATKLDELISDLGTYRELVPPKPSEGMAPHENLRLIRGANWRILPHWTPNVHLLQICDPRFGRLDYVLPIDEAERLGKTLQQID
jgi:hypothetical protein